MRYPSVYYLVLLGALVLLPSCAKEPPPPPPVPNAPEDLSFWSVPELVQPPPVPEPVPTPPKDKPTPAEQILDYALATTFVLKVPIGAPLDVVLQPGEQVRNIIGGERKPSEDPKSAQWDIKEGADGIGETLRHHLFITAATPGMTTGFLVTTTHRTYYLTCTSVGKSPIRTVRWRYPADLAPPAPAKEPGLLPDPAQPKHYHVGYTLTSSQRQPPEWLPRYAIDDGKKMYIVYPEIALFQTVPVVRMIGPNGPALINARQFLNVVIIDQLAPRLELRIGLGDTAEVVTITRGNLRTITCPEDAECPVWPQAAQVLARKSPPGQPALALQGTPPPPPPGPAPGSPPLPPRQTGSRVSQAPPTPLVQGEHP